LLWTIHNFPGYGTVAGVAPLTRHWLTTEWTTTNMWLTTDWAVTNMWLTIDYHLMHWLCFLISYWHSCCRCCTSRLCSVPGLWTAFQRRTLSWTGKANIHGH
jgi:hypothetical protein